MPMIGNLMEVYFFVDGELMAVGHLPAIPRKGESIWVAEEDYIVKGVEWNLGGDETGKYSEAVFQVVNIDIYKGKG